MTAVQPFLFSDSVWIPIKDGNISALSIFKRHYSARASRKIEQMVGPGGKMVLITRDALALFAWRKFISDNGQTGVNCAVFRNEGTDAGRSSDLIRAASVLAWERWPGQRLYTYVDASKVRRKRDPGRCFLRAGWRYCGVSKSGKLILENVSAMPICQSRSEEAPRAKACQSDLLRCDQEIAEILARPEDYPYPAYLSAMGINDWEVEKRLILAGTDVHVLHYGKHDTVKAFGSQSVGQGACDNPPGRP